MVANRVAPGRERANQILALNPARRHHFPPPRRHRQIALAHRARLSRAQAGGGARPLRRTWVARLPPPRDAVHRSLRIPDLRAGGDSPLTTLSRLAAPATCTIRRLPPQRLRPCVPNGTLRIQSQPCAGD